jgi:SAM-dependent methyltransferase
VAREDAAQREVVAYFTAVQDDYLAWSPEARMHFGYLGFGTNPLDREAMLARMDDEVVRRLALGNGPVRAVDLGCGVGATARALARRHPGAVVDAVTLVPAQVVDGEARTRAAGLTERVRFRLADFTATGLPQGAYDGAFALESACYAEGDDKAALLAEAHRLLLPGGRLVVMDAFLRREGPLPVLVRDAYQHFLAGFAVPEFATLSAFTRALGRVGFERVATEDLSWRIAASVAQVPFAVAGHLLRGLSRPRQRLAKRSLGHLAASLACVPLGLARSHVGYFAVTARKALQTPTTRT